MSIKTTYVMKESVKVTFYARKQPLKNGLYPLLMRISFGGERITVGQIGIYLTDPTYLKSNQVTSECPNSNEYNLQLMQERVEVERIAFEEGPIFCLDDIKKRYLLSKNKTKTLSILDVYREYLEVRKKEQEKTNVCKKTRNKWVNSLKLFEAFAQQSKKLSSLNIRNLSEDVFYDYESYLLKTCGYEENTASKYLVYLKSVANYATDCSYIAYSKIAKCQLPKKESKVVPLNGEELKALYNARFDKKHLSMTQEMFLFACFTGLSYCDVKSLTKGHIKTIGDTEFIIKDRLKTKVEADIPLIAPAQFIINKYKEGHTDDEPFMPIISNQKINQYLKEIAAELNIKTKLTYHVARHTFATLSLDAGVSLETIAKMLGHSDTRTTKIYAKITRQKIRKEIKFFSKEIDSITSNEQENTSRMKKKNKPIIAIDFDGVIVKDNYPLIGEIQEGAKEALEYLNQYCTVIIWTCRDGLSKVEATEWMKDNNIKFDHINQNSPENINRFNNDCRKVYADIYVDDRQVGGFRGWEETLRLIKTQLREYYKMETHEWI